MKKILVISLLLALCLALCGCGSFVSLMPGAELAEEAAAEEAESFRPEALFDFLGMEEFAQSYYDNTPIAVSYIADGEGPSPRFDRASIIQACDALRGMTVTAPCESSAGEPNRQFVFTMADGSTHTVRFADRILAAYTGDFEAEGGEALWDIAFPGYDDSFDIFDLYTDSKMREFADNFGANTPVSVGRRVNGGALLTSEEAEVVARAFDILQNAEIDRVEASPDQNVNLNHQEEYIFTMADGSAVTVLFTGSCLTVKNNETYGPVYYWISGAEELQAMEILPADTDPDFAGGAVAGLRPDIQEAADAANGLIEGKTVIGVYVSYVIDGQEGIATFQNENAAAFMQYLAGLNVTAEKQETPPEGEAITISVTLSDWSGPILNFTGDVIQETIGTWYRCEESSFDALQQRILQEAANQAAAEAEEDSEDEEE